MGIVDEPIFAVGAPRSVGWAQSADGLRVREGVGARCQDDY